jgi:hypothetical protein
MRYRVIPRIKTSGIFAVFTFPNKKEAAPG